MLTEREKLWKNECDNCRANPCDSRDRCCVVKCRWDRCYDGPNEEEEKKMSKQKEKKLTKDEKDLLIKDLTSRLKWGVKVLHRGDTEDLISIEQSGCFKIAGYDYWFDLDSTPALPYLRPLSNMTDEEKAEIGKDYRFHLIGDDGRCFYIYLHSDGCWDEDTDASLADYIDLIDWLNDHHFDYRGLIGKGLALPATDGMY